MHHYRDWRKRLHRAQIQKAVKEDKDECKRHQNAEQRDTEEIRRMFFLDLAETQRQDLVRRMKSRNQPNQYLAWISMQNFLSSSTKVPKEEKIWHGESAHFEFPSKSDS